MASPWLVPATVPETTQFICRRSVHTLMSPRQRERVQRISCPDDDVLSGVEQIGFGAVAGVGAETRVPQWLAGQCIVSDKVPAPIVSEQQPAGRAEQSDAGTSTS